MHDFHVGIEHITRVEGHGNIIIDVKEGKDSRTADGYSGVSTVFRGDGTWKDV